MQTLIKNSDVCQCIFFYLKQNIITVTGNQKIRKFSDLIKSFSIQQIANNFRIPLSIYLNVFRPTPLLLILGLSQATKIDVKCQWTRWYWLTIDILRVRWVEAIPMCGYCYELRSMGLLQNNSFPYVILRSWPYYIQI